MTGLADLTAAQIATAITVIGGVPTTPKTYNTKSRAKARLEALMAEKGLGMDDVLRAAGLAVATEHEPVAEPEPAADDAPAEAAIEADDQPLDAAGMLASDTLAGECREILLKYLSDLGLDAETAHAAAERAVNALPPPVPATRTRTDTKQARMIDMLRRPQGATITELATTLGWQHHSVRGMIAAGLKKRMGLSVVSEKSEQGERIYRIANAG